MADKLVTTILYLLIGGSVICFPMLIKAVRGDSQAAYPRLLARPYLTIGLLALLSAWVFWIDAAHNHRLAICAAIVAMLGAATVRRQGWWMIALGGLLGLILAMPMPWWQRQTDFIMTTRRQVEIYGVLCLIMMGLLTREFVVKAAVPSLRTKIIATLIFVPVAALLCFGTGVTENLAIYQALWHHWGAFIGPAELMAGGVHVLHDIPLQYGLGPTALIALTCGQNCWLSAYYAVGTTTFLVALLVLLTALSFGIRSLLAIAVITAATLVCCFCWTSYGGGFSSPIVFPSVEGLRFVPVVALVAALCLFDGNRNWKKIGHALWALGALWSPESLFAVSFVWWPYYCWQALAALQWRQVPLGFMRALGRLIFVGAIVLAGFVCVYGLAYHDLPRPHTWLAYMLYPPAAMPINLKGVVWWYVAVLVLGLSTLVRVYRDRGNSAPFRRNFLVVLMGYAVLSYCMGRSHDNNFLNLAPYALLILVGAFTSDGPIFLRAIGAAMIASTIGWGAVFGFNVWQDVYQAHALFEMNPHKMIGSFTFLDPETVEKTRSINKTYKIDLDDPADIARAMMDIESKSGEPVTVLDYSFLVIQNGPRNVWDAYHAPANYVFLPEAWRTQYAVLTANRLQKSGWVIVDKKFEGEMFLKGYRAAYSLAEEEDYGTCQAYHFVPKPVE